MIRLLQKLVRYRYVDDRAFKSRYHFSVDGGFEHKGDSQNVYTRKGGALAQYAGRFVLISFDDFASIMFEDKTNSIWTQYPALKEKSNTQAYINEYNKIVDDFYQKYANQREQGNNNAIDEEFSHHQLIRETSTYVILNALTIYYRICSCYLTHHRYYKKTLDLKVSESLINTYLIRSHIIEITYPIVEASYHYHDNLLEVERKYGEMVKEWCEKFILLEKKLKEKYNERNISKLMELTQKVLLSFPYITAIIQCSKLDLNKFISCFDSSFTRMNEELFKNILDKVDATRKNNTALSNDLKTFLDAEKEKRNTNTQLDKLFLASLIYLGTETSDDFIPNSLKWFVLKQLITCKNKKVLFTILRNSMDVNGAYQNYPPIKCIGDKNQSFCIDQSMKVFDGEEFIMAQKSFEPTFAGENGYIDLSKSDVCRTLLIQALLIKSLSLVFFHDKQLQRSDFVNEFKQLLSAMPDDNKQWIRNEVLPMFYEKAMGILEVYDIKKNNMEIVAERFERCIKDLYEKIEKFDSEKQESLYMLCDINYVHGY